MSPVTQSKGTSWRSLQSVRRWEEAWRAPFTASHPLSNSGPERRSKAPGLWTQRGETRRQGGRAEPTGVGVTRTRNHSCRLSEVSVAAGTDRSLVASKSAHLSSPRPVVQTSKWASRAQTEVSAELPFGLSLAAQTVRRPSTKHDHPGWQSY